MFGKDSALRRWSVLLVALLLALTSLQSALATRPPGVRFAKPAAIGAGDCSSWANACTLQTALNTAISGDEIWAAVGIHKPTSGTERSATFQLVSGVAVYGGFVATETLRTERNPAANITILSGDLNGDDAGFSNNLDNVYHVVTGATGATLDGFTIRAGNADAIAPNNSGAGMYNSSSSPTLANLTFKGNSAFWSGGGMYNTAGSKPELTNVTFSGNRTALWGGGMYNDSSSPTLTNVTFSGNIGDGGGMYNSSSGPTLANVTFSGNLGSNRGGGMYNTAGSSPTISNTIFWGNTAYSDAQIYNDSSTPVVSDSVVQGGCPAGSTCTNVITTDPKLGTLGSYGYGGSTQTIPLLPGSSAIDTGNDAACPAADQRGVTRPKGTHCDVGAYEYDHVVFTVYYARLAASGTGTCSSWADACTLQSALGTTSSGDEIWVAAGTYKPTTDPTERNAVFQLKDGVSVYGGFAGTEAARDQRDPAANATILSGDIDNNDSQKPIITDLASVTGNTTNSWHVITGTTTTVGMTLDGFTITGGYAVSVWAGDPDSGSGMYNAFGSNLTLAGITFSGNMAKYGGGMFNLSSSPALTNVTFNANSADRGGGMYNTSGSNAKLTNVAFSHNAASYNGGGMANYGDALLLNVVFHGNSADRGGGMANTSGITNISTLTDVTFVGNTATTIGGGMYNSFTSNPTLSNVTFTSNTATQTGGGMYCDGNARLSDVTFDGNSANFGGGMFNNVVNVNVGSPRLINVTFSRNSAFSSGGGMVNNTNSHPMLTNTTFISNTATNDGGGMYNSSSTFTLTNATFGGNSANRGGGMGNLSSHPFVRNTILWNNTASSAGAQVWDSGSAAIASDSVVQGGYAGTNIITADPLLGALGNYGGAAQTIPILAGSSAFNTGNDGVCPATDQRAVTRPQGAHCDIGAFEYEVDEFSVYLPLVLRP